MNRYCTSGKKLVHLDVVMCADMSSTVDGTKCLREPLSTSATDSKMSQRLIPRPSHKPVKSCNQNFQISGISAFNCDYVDVDPSDTDGNRREECTEMGCSDNQTDNVNESAQPKCSVEFMSARKYMNPTYSLLDESASQSSKVASLLLTHGSVPVTKPSRRPHTKHVVTTQKNSLDRYFRPVYASETNTFHTVSLSQSHTTEHFAEHLANFSFTPENSPRKSVQLSPITKLPGSDNIYYSSQSSQNSASHDRVTSSRSLSFGVNASEKHNSSAPASASRDDDDDLDFEASFDYIWKTNPPTKRKPAKQSGQASKRKTTATADVNELNKKSVDTQCEHGASAATRLLQQHNAVSPNMSAENFGLFGFSNNTLLTLDSDTDFEEDTVDYFSCLPPEVVSNILCRLPFTDLCLTVNRVCLSWRDIIESDNVSYVMFLWLFCVVDYTAQ